MNLPATFAHIVVDEADGLILTLRITQQVAHQHLACLPGAYDQGLLSRAVIDFAILEPAVEKPRPRKQGEQQQRVQRDHGSRHIDHAGQQEYRHGRQRHGRRHSLADADQVGNRSEPPDAAIQAEVEKHPDVHHDDDR